MSHTDERDDVSDGRDWDDPGARPGRRPLPPELDPRGGGAPDRAAERATAAYRGVARSSLPPRPATQRVVPPPSRRPPTKRRWARVLSWVAVSMSVVILGTSTALYVLVNKYDANIARIDVFGGSRAEAPAAAPRDAQNILIVGSDSRGDTDAGGEFQGSGDTFVTGQRSDTVILAHLYGSSDKAQLVSFPRDSYVSIPAFTDPKSGKTTSARKGKLNSAFSTGGPPLLIATIENLTQIRVDHYMQIDFQGFQSMVDKLGGVEVCLSKPAKDRFSGIDLPAGRHKIGGRTALAFVRQRHGLAGGDIDRITRQQQFLGSMVRKVLSAGTLANPLKLTGFLDVATSSLQVDNDLTVGDLKDLAIRFKSFNAGGVSFATIPITDIAAYRNRESVVLIDDDKATALFDALRRDEAPDSPKPKPTATASGDPLIVKPGSIRVKVYNGAGVAGLGRKAAADLTEIGFQMSGIPENRGSGATGTTVLHGPDKADSARTLAAALPGAVVQEDPSLGNVLEVVVGSAYSGAKAVTVTGSASPTKAPTASATPKVVTAQDDPCTA
ncbi:MAG: LCP family protein [Mycobacteriales bacterium]|nr:LCP family protein [Mycobacteriales bacterium]